MLEILNVDLSCILVNQSEQFKGGNRGRVACTPDLFEAAYCSHFQTHVTSYYMNRRACASGGSGYACTRVCTRVSCLLSGHNSFQVADAYKRMHAPTGYRTNTIKPICIHCNHPLPVLYKQHSTLDYTTCPKPASVVGHSVLCQMADSGCLYEV